MEEIISLVKTYFINKHGSLIVVIPKEAVRKLGFEHGMKFLVKIDDKNRLIYERV